MICYIKDALTGNPIFVSQHTGEATAIFYQPKNHHDAQEKLKQ